MWQAYTYMITETSIIGDAHTSSELDPLLLPRVIAAQLCLRPRLCVCLYMYIDLYFPKSSCNKIGNNEINENYITRIRHMAISLFS